MLHQPHQIKLSIPDGPFARKLRDWVGRWSTSEQRASGLVLDGGVSLTEGETAAMLRELVDLFAEENVDLTPHLDRLIKAKSRTHGHKQSPLSDPSLLGALLQFGLPLLSSGAGAAETGERLAGIVKRTIDLPR